MTKKIFTLITIITALLWACAGVIGTMIAYKSLSLESDRFQIENRPYAVIGELKWIGNAEDLFLLGIKSNWISPLNLVVKMRISDNKNNTIFEKDYRDDVINILPSEKEKTISVNFNKIKSYPDSINNLDISPTNWVAMKLVQPGEWTIKLRAVEKTELEKEGIYSESDDKTRFTITPNFIWDIRDRLNKNEIFLLEVELHYDLLNKNLDSEDYKYSYTEKRYLHISNGVVEARIIKKYAD